jgi:hypothetical protein
MTGGGARTSHRARPERRHRAGAPAPRAVEPAQGTRLVIRMEVRLVGGAAGRVLAAAQGRALSALLATLCETEVGQDEEVSP